MKKDIFFHGDYSPRYQEGYNIIEKAKLHIKEQKKQRTEIPYEKEGVEDVRERGEEKKNHSKEINKRMKKHVKKSKKSVDRCGKLW